MLIQSEVVAVKQKNDGAEVVIKVSDKSILNNILKYKESGKVIAELRIDDGRTITNLQRRKFYATVKDIADYLGDVMEYYKEYFKSIYCYRNKKDDISLSNCSITEGRELINIALEFALSNDIPLMDLSINRTDDIDKLLYLCLIKKKCCICGKPGEVHHVDTIGMGNNRKTTNHIGKRAISLCRIHHTEAHSLGRYTFEKRYKIYGLVLDKYLVEKLNL